VRERLSRLSPTIRGMLWAIAAGIAFSLLNTILRGIALELDPLQTQFLRYFLGFTFFVPWMLSRGIVEYWPNDVPRQVLRGTVHTAGLFLWFTALPKIPLADGTAFGFTVPIFVMLGAAIFLRERMVPARWMAAVIALIGVIIVLAPKLTGSGGIYNLVMLASQPLFAASVLITKSLTRRDRPEVIVMCQAFMVSVLTLPFALMHWVAPSPMQWMWFVVCAVFGTIGQYCNARALGVADASATQSAKFLDLIWASFLGFLVFGDIPTESTIAGGLIIVAATVWISHRESRRR
jgi:drug/metabolite transporter (DMT)-like permease